MAYISHLFGVLLISATVHEVCLRTKDEELRSCWLKGLVFSSIPCLSMCFRFHQNFRCRACPQIEEFTADLSSDCEQRKKTISKEHFYLEEAFIKKKILAQSTFCSEISRHQWSLNSPQEIADFSCSSWLSFYSSEVLFFSQQCFSSFP